MRSYAQNFEDVMLHRALSDVTQGFYVDIGAGDPDEDSVSKIFYELGWSGINVEPLPKNLDKFKLNRPRDINLNCAVGDSDTVKSLYKTLGMGGLSTFSKNIAENYQEKGIIDEILEVEVLSLNSIFKAHLKSRNIHFLKIDVEGFEREVLLGIDLQKYRPWVLCIEAVDPITRKQNWQLWEKLLTSKNYVFVYGDGLNRFYLAFEHLERIKHFLSPPNIFDTFEK